MDLHHYTGHPVCQLETLLRNVNTELAELDGRLPPGNAGLENSLAHLRNNVELLAAAAQGYAWTVEGTLALISQLADDSELPKSLVAQLLEPAKEHLGELYVVAATAR